MGKRATKTYAHSSEIYKQPTARKAVLIVGFVVSLVALAFALVVLLSFFLSGVGAGVAELFGKPLLEAEKLLCWIGIGASIVGTILSVAGANLQGIGGGGGFPGMPGVYRGAAGLYFPGGV